MKILGKRLLKKKRIKILGKRILKKKRNEWRFWENALKKTKDENTNM
jgi:hypothetical protein